MGVDDTTPTVIHRCAMDDKTGVLAEARFASMTVKSCMPSHATSMNAKPKAILHPGRPTHGGCNHAPVVAAPTPATASSSEPVAAAQQPPQSPKSRAQRSSAAAAPLTPKTALLHAALGAGIWAGARLLSRMLSRRGPHALIPGHRKRQAGRKPAIMWFRSDLRLHDNEALLAAAAQGSYVLPVYCFDPREYGKEPSGFDKTGPRRARFLLEAVSDLRNRLRAIGSDLIVRVGRPEEVLPDLAAAVGAGSVHCQGEVTYEEVQVEAGVKSGLQLRCSPESSLSVHWGGTMMHLQDLPFKLTNMPGCYADFRDGLARTRVRSSAAAPDRIKGLPPACSGMDPGALPTLQQLGFGPRELLQLQVAPGGRRPAACDQPLSAAGLRGGESAALEHLQTFIQELKSSSSNSSVGSSSRGSAAAPTCKITPWLALGCLSPRFVYSEISRQLGTPALSALVGCSHPVNSSSSSSSSGGGSSAGARGTSAPTAAHKEASSAPLPSSAGSEQPGSWLVFELMWRDFFRFVTHKYTAMTSTVNAATTSRTATASGATSLLQLGSSSTSASMAISMA